ncbi:AsmA family protein [Alcaligenaceae bacterium CGII-47]|nr:AsmA family protein [Alcaligenaceae bacterium CGII-47]
MSVWFKRLVFGLVILVIVALVGLSIFILTFNPNAYKNKLEQLVYNRYERTLTIKGEIGLSLFPRIGLSVQDVALSDRDGKRTFVSMDGARFAVAIWPLLSNRLVVDHVSVTGFKAWVTRDKEGRFNFSDLISTEAFHPPANSLDDAGAVLAGALVVAPSADGRADPQIDIAGLALKNGQIHYLDEQTGTALTLSDLDVNTGRMTYDQAFDVTLKGHLLGVTPVADAQVEAQALLRLDPNTRGYSAQKINVQLVGGMAELNKASITLKGNLAYSGTARTFAANGVELGVQGGWVGAKPVSEIKASLSVPKLRLDQRQSELKVEKLSLRATGKSPEYGIDAAFDAPALSISPEAAKGDPVTGTLKLTGASTLAMAVGLEGLSGNAELLQFQALSLDAGISRDQRLLRLQLTSPASWNLSLKKGELSAMKGDMSIQDAALPGGRFEFPMIGSVQLDLIKDMLGADINAVINGGQLELKAQAERLDTPKVTFSLDAGKLDLNNWLTPLAQPPKAKAETDKKPVANNAASEPKAPAKPAETPKPAVVTPAATPIDWSLITPLDITGQIKVDDLRVRDLQLRTVSGNVRAQGGKLEISKVAAKLYEGQLSASLSARDDASVKLQLNLDKIAVEPFMQALLKDGHLSGTGSLQAAFEARGATTEMLIASLAGKTSLQIRQGAIRGFDAAQTLQEASQAMGELLQGGRATINNPYDMSRRTPFSALDGRIDFSKGVGTFNKVLLVTDLLRVSEGKPAQVDLLAQRLDLQLNALVTNKPTKDMVPVIGALRGVSIPVLISGPFKSLVYDVQWQSISNKSIKDAVKAGLTELLSDALIQNAVPDVAPGAATPEAPQTPADPVKRIGDALKGLLGK